MKMLAQRCGIDLTDYKKSAMLNRLVKRLRFLKIPDFDTYCNRLRIDLEEELIFINLITNSTTQFFREAHHFHYLEKILFPALLAKQNKIRIWSAGCSTGQEPYSIAMTIYDFIKDNQNIDVKILATDINSDALMTAEVGVYSQDEIKNFALLNKKKWFMELPNHQHFFQVKDELKKLVTFNQLNLIESWPMHGPFDIIFCRNVLIYFKQEICQQILARFWELLNTDGTLFLGHSESLYELREKYQSIGTTIFKKI